jgi:hypothetical protein
MEAPPPPFLSSMLFLYKFEFRGISSHLIFYIFCIISFLANMKVAITLDKSTEYTTKEGECESHVSDSQS